MNTISTETVQPLQSINDLTIMVIDDSKTILKTAEILLNEQGCTVLTANDGFESLAIIAVEKPDMIFLDVMMPRLDGYQTCALIKSNAEYQSIPVIMLSSKDSLFDMARGRLAGSESYITKPFTRNDLITVIQNYLDEINQPTEQAPIVPDEEIAASTLEIEDNWEPITATQTINTPDFSTDLYNELDEIELLDNKNTS